jgi:hypothetical protein
MHIAFLTLFLGLVQGVHPVALDASPGVAAVELVLDGRSAGRLVDRIGGSPWTGQVDFGRALLPHHLEARALGADGSELARAEQWLNVARQPAEVDVVPVGGKSGSPGALRLAWQSVVGSAPSEIHLSVDGAALAVDARGMASLPGLAPRVPHLVSAELRFPDGLEARKDIVLTAGSAGGTATELTAMPIRTKRPQSPLAAAELGGAFTSDGKPAAVVAVEREEADVFVVRAPLTGTVLPAGNPMATSPAKRYGLFATDRRIHFRLVASAPSFFPTSQGTSEVFAISPGLKLPAMSALLGAGRAQAEIAGRPRLADAVASAGLHALARQVPRAVVLVLGGGGGAATPDASALDPAAVRSYLDAIGVPLFVWSLDGKRSAGAWGEAADISAAWGLRDAYERLARELGRQQIVWLEGRHLPQSIALAPAARDKGIELVAGAGR